MSVLRGVASGLGEGMMATGRLFGEAALNDQRASLELDKQKALEQFRLDQKQGERDRVAGIVTSARQSAIDTAHQGDDPFGPNPSPAAYDRLGDRAAITALTNSGDIESAAVLDKMADSGKKLVPWGSTYVDENGVAIYDNGADLKGSIQKQNSEAKAAAVSAKGQPKPVTQEQIDRITTQTDKIVTNNLGGAKNPFAMPGEDPKTAGDAAKQNLMSTALSTMAVNAARSGETLNPSEGFNQLKPVVEKFDQKVTADARARAAQFFDDKGRPKDGAAAALQNANVPDAAAADKTSFMRWYRDTKLSDVDGFKQFRGSLSSQGGAKPSPAAQPEVPAPAEKRPEPAPPRSIVDMARSPSKADTLGSTFSERQSSLQERMQKAEADPELQNLQAQKAQALRDNKAVLANNYLAQYNQIRKDRYGL